MLRVKMAEEIILGKKLTLAELIMNHRGEQRVSKHRTPLKIAPLHLE